MSKFIYFDHGSKKFENGFKLLSWDYYSILGELNACSDEVKIKLIDNEWIHAVKTIWYGDDGERHTRELLASICEKTQEMFIVIQVEWNNIGGDADGHQISFGAGGIWIEQNDYSSGNRERSFKMLPKTYTLIKKELVDGLICIHPKELIDITMAYISNLPIDKYKRLI